MIDGDGDFRTEFKNCRFRHNESQETPGIRCLAPHLLIEESEFWNNTKHSGNYALVSHTEKYFSYLYTSVVKNCNFTENTGLSGVTLAYIMNSESMAVLSGFGMRRLRGGNI